MIVGQPHNPCISHFRGRSLEWVCLVTIWWIVSGHIGIISGVRSQLASRAVEPIEQNNHHHPDEHRNRGGMASMLLEPFQMTGVGRVHSPTHPCRASKEISPRDGWEGAGVLAQRLE